MSVKSFTCALFLTVGRAWGSDARIYDFVTLSWYPEKLQRTQDYVWCSDGRSFVYTVVEKQRNWPHRVLLHRVGTPANEDVLLYEEQDPRFAVCIADSSSGRYILIGTEQEGQTSEWRALASNDPLSPLLLLQPRKEGWLYGPDHSEDVGFVFLSSGPKEPNGRLAYCATVEVAGGRGAWKELFAASEMRILRDFLCVRGKIVVECNATSVDAADELLVLDLCDRSLDYTVALPTYPGYPHHVSLSEQNFVFDATTIRYELADLVHPTRVMELNLATKQSRQLRQQQVHGYDPHLYESKRLWAPSRDGQSRIPISIVYKRSAKLADAPILISGYSAYGCNSYPDFRRSIVSLLDRSVCHAIVHARGCSMLGRAWYDDGRKLHKMNSIFDLLDGAMFLAENGFCDASKIVIDGASAGGLLVLGAMVLAPPGLLAGVIAEVPFCHVIASMRDKSLPLTMQELEEWGDPEDAAALDYMKQYSPYDCLQKGRRYPPVLLSAALADHQVMFHEPAMFAKKLQWCHRSNKVFLQTSMESFGHDGNVQRLSGLEECARAFAFVLWAAKRASKKRTVVLVPIRTSDDHEYAERKAHQADDLLMQLAESQ